MRTKLHLITRQGSQDKNFAIVEASYTLHLELPGIVSLIEVPSDRSWPLEQLELRRCLATVYLHLLGLDLVQ